MAPNHKKEFTHFEPKNLTEWRNWLSSNYQQKEGIWLVLCKKESGLPTISVNDAIDEALCFGWVDSLPNKIDEQRFKLFISPRNPKSKWSAVNKNKVAKLINENRMHVSGLAMVDLAKKSGTWDALNDVENGLIPEDLKISLDNFPNAAVNFENFPKSAKRGILETILNAKRPETRAKRIEETARLAAENKRAFQFIKEKS